MAKSIPRTATRDRLPAKPIPWANLFNSVNSVPFVFPKASFNGTARLRPSLEGGVFASSAVGDKTITCEANG